LPYFALLDKLDNAMFRHRFFYPLPSLFLFLLLAGCGTGEYEQRLAKRSSRAPVMNFNELYQPQALPDVPVSVRVPVVFKDPPLVAGVPGKDGNPLDPRRIQPNLFELSWLKFTYEGFIDNPNGAKTPFYCYVAAVNKAANNLPDPMPGWRAELAGRGGNVTEWADFQGQTPDGRSIPWKTIRFTGPQDFWTGPGPDQFAPMPGVLDIYLHNEANYYILFAWRVPSAIEQQVNSAKWATMMAGCVEVKQ
jgi:hypothetical protein